MRICSIKIHTYYLSSLYLDLYPSDSVYTIITYSPHTLLDAWVQIQVYPTFPAPIREDTVGLCPTSPPPRFLVYNKSSTKHLQATSLSVLVWADTGSGAGCELQPPPPPPLLSPSFFFAQSFTLDAQWAFSVLNPPPPPPSICPCPD